MADFDDLPQRAFAPRLTRMQGDVEDPYSTADILGQMNKPETFPDWLKRQADKIPESGRHLAPRGPDESLFSYWKRAADALSVHDMAKGGVNTVANWLGATKGTDQQAEPGQGYGFAATGLEPSDTLAPLGLAPMGMALTPRNAVGSMGGKLRETSPAAGHLADSVSPNPTLADRLRDLEGHTPASSQSSQGPAGHSLTGDALSSGTSELPLSAAVRAALDDPKSYYGIRVTEEPLRVGDRAPESRQWYQDYDTDARLYTPEELAARYPDHGDSLGGTSTVGLTPDLAAARKLAQQYYGDHVSLLRGSERRIGNDPGEWVIPDAEVVATAQRPRRDFDLFADQARANLPGTVLNSLPMDEASRAQKNSLDQTQALTRAGTGLGHPDSVPGALPDQAWFSGSKIVDDAGQPKRLYHGTKSPFDKFDMKKAGATDEGLAGRAFYLTHDPEDASSYALRDMAGKGDTPSTIPAHASMKNPFVIKNGVLPDGRAWQEVHQSKGGFGITREGGDAIQQLAEAGGHDGIVFADAAGNVRHVAAFKPNTVRSATTGETLFSDQSRASVPGAVINSLSESGFEPGWYHGTRTAGFSEFSTDDTLRANSNNGFRGVSMTRDPNEASGYTGVGLGLEYRYSKDTLPQKLGLKEPTRSVVQVGHDFGHGKGAVYPLAVKIDNPFIWDIDDFSRPGNDTLRRVKEIMPDYNEGDFPIKQRAALSDALLGAGYDAIDIVSGGKVRERAAFKKGSIKSATTGETLFSKSDNQAGTAINALGEAQKAGLPERAFGKKPIKAASEDIYEVLESQFPHGRVVGNQMMPIDRLKGGVSADPAETKRVADLVAAMSGPEGYRRRLIVDTEGNVIEGQHRLEALRQLGEKNVPVHVIEDMTLGLDMDKLNAAVAALGLPKQQQRQLLQNALESAREAGSGAKALETDQFPKGWEDKYSTVLRAIDEAQKAGMKKFDFDTKGGGHREAKVGDTTIEYGVARDGQSAEVILVKTPKEKRGQGSARAAMEQFISEADESGKTLFLNSDPMDKGVSKPKLDAFYKSLGFVKNTGKNKDFTSRAEFVRPAKPKSAFGRGGGGEGGDAGLKKQESSSSLPPNSQLPERAFGIKAYHGSPHDFDKFDATKIGTGEGAQAYGHGLYFAENEGVARSYRDQLGDYSGAAKWKGDQPPTPLQQKFLQQLGGPDAASGQPMTVDMLKGEYARRIRNEEAAAEGMYGIKIPEAADRAKQLRQDLEELNRVADKIEVAPPSGRMYEVRINADPESFLDWDKPLSQQSASVKKAIGFDMPEAAYLKAQAHADELESVYAKLGGEDGAVADEGALIKRAHELEDLLAKIDPKGLSQFRINNMAHGADTAQKLKDAGIPGIKYLDQGSRAGGDGTRNYVVFDADKIEILKKYGWVPAGMVGGGMMMVPPDDAQASQLPERAFKD